MKAIVTGAGGGMGAHFATRLAQAGAQVAICDLDDTKLKEVAARSNDLPGTIHWQVCDIAKESDIERFVDWAHDVMGGLNGLVNNAGLLHDRLLVKKDRKTGEVTKMTREDWDRVIDVNLTGATFMVRDVVANMASSNTPGVIVNMSSLSRHGNRGQTSYVAAKAALAANTVTWAQEFAPFGIRVGAIAPGMIETPMTQGMNDKARERLISMIPVRRVGEPEDIWKAVQFIIECDYFTGRTLDVDGGLSM